jgi:hypothetical protein
MNELADRKRMLVLQSDLHRALLQAEAASVRDRLERLNQVREVARSASPWLMAGAAAVGLLATWRGRKLTGMIPVAVAAWKTWKSLRSG